MILEYSALHAYNSHVKFRMGSQKVETRKWCIEIGQPWRILHQRTCPLKRAPVEDQSDICKGYLCYLTNALGVATGVLEDWK
ncbi:hypothetical protein VNO77_03239 [Canavalia gladiata]|uniref:Uncharacterized protein n=1 Tax=Canavalia gladiata TaxID=3824 RepID=A0AAN9MZI5_CANGL